MVSRSVSNPIFVGLGSATILALTAALQAAIAAETPDPNTTPTDSQSAAPAPAPAPATESAAPMPTPPPPSPVLHVNMVLYSHSAHAGDSVKVRVYVYATEAEAEDTRLWLNATSNSTVSPLQFLGTVGNDAEYRTLTVTVPKSMETGSITVTATASSGQVKDVDQDKISVTKKVTSSPSSNHSSGSSGSGNASGPSGAGTPVSSPPSSPSGALQSPAVKLPEISAAAPSTAPNVVVAPPHTLRSGGSPQVQELTFQRLASTQAAWLAALLMAFSVVLTQVRLARPARRRPRGEHRRPRNGVFQR